MHKILTIAHQSEKLEADKVKAGRDIVHGMPSARKLDVSKRSFINWHLFTLY